MDARGWRLILDEHLAAATAYDVPELLLTSYGGSGLNMLADWAQQYRRVVTHLWICQLCHTVHSLVFTRRWWWWVIRRPPGIPWTVAGSGC